MSKLHHNSKTRQESQQFMSPEDAHLILSLRLLIARTANQDSLQWWDDGSLTAQGSYLLERLFPVAPPLAARKLALTAALTRHDAACPSGKNHLHLYHLDDDNQDTLALRNYPLLWIPVPAGPIRSHRELEKQLHALLGERLPVTVVRRLHSGAVEIKLPPASNKKSKFAQRAAALGWAYLEGDMHHPVFPYCLEKTSD